MGRRKNREGRGEEAKISTRGKNYCEYKMSKIWGILFVVGLAAASVNATRINRDDSRKTTPKSASPSTTVPSSSVGRVTSVATTEMENRRDSVWECPNMTRAAVECSCDFPHTLRCTGDRTALQTISQHLKKSREGTISLLDVTVTGISTLPGYFIEDVALHGLVVSTGELRGINENAFTGLAGPLRALGLPNNVLETVPIAALGRLVGLDRLDLSHNRLDTLEAASFANLTDLTYLDLCDNLLSQLSPKAFEPLRALRSLRMRGNRLSVSALSALRGLKNLEELDLSGNLLVGSLGANLLPPMRKLRFLTVSENELVNVRQGALVGLGNLSYLSLSHNQIDVLEDHSFKHLSTLTRLDLANNRIVAVSSASLAHLDKLTSLDLTHNFLRSLTADLVIPLKSLEDLRLDDNDITMVSSEVPTSELRLKRLSLADNPLNCDCTLLEFANWLSNSSLRDEDKASAVCATPPALENGILTQVSPGSLLCGEPTPPLMTRVPLAGAQLTLKEFNYDEEMAAVDLVWRVEPCTERYTCDNLIIYEAIGGSEVEIESSPLRCDSSLMPDPCSLTVPIPVGINLQPGHEYRYCVVLLVPLAYEEFSLGLGCSDIITLEKPTNNDKYSKQRWLSTIGDIAKGSITNFTGSLPIPRERITAVRVNVSERGFLRIDVSLASVGGTTDSMSPECELSVAVFEGESALHREKLNCTLTFVTMSGLTPGRYKVCASLDNADEDDEDVVPENENRENRDVGRSRCVEVQASRRRYTEIIAILVAAIACAAIVALYLIGRTLVRRVRHPRIQAQCFLPAQEFDITHKGHYIKLLATTKV